MLLVGRVSGALSAVNVSQLDHVVLCAKSGVTSDLLAFPSHAGHSEVCACANEVY